MGDALRAECSRLHAHPIRPTHAPTRRLTPTPARRTTLAPPLLRLSVQRDQPALRQLGIRHGGRPTARGRDDPRSRQRSRQPAKPGGEGVGAKPVPGQSPGHHPAAVAAPPSLPVFEPPAPTSDTTSTPPHRLFPALSLVPSDPNAVVAPPDTVLCRCGVCASSHDLALIAAPRQHPMAVWPLESLIPLEEENKPSNIPGRIFWFE